MLQAMFNDVSLAISGRRRQITTIWQSLPIISKVLILIRWTIMIPFTLALTFSVLLTLVFVIPGLFLFLRWASIVVTGDSYIDIGDTKVPTFFSTEERDSDGIAYVFCMSVVGVAFGGIHCVGWFFNFPSNDEAILWRVSSAVLTGIAFIFPIVITFVDFLLKTSNSSLQQRNSAVAAFSIVLLVYVVSRLLLLLEAFISLRHLTLGMLALVKWTSFIPHI